MAGYIGNKSSVVSSGAERKFKFAITETTTTLSNLAYTRDLVHVFHNGVRLVDGTDYTATNGTSITLTNAAENGDEVVVISYASFQPSDTVSASTGGVFEGNITVNGDLTVDADTLFVDAATNEVGIGTTTAARSARLTVKAGNSTLGSGYSQLSVITSDAQAADVGGSIVLGGQSTAADWVYGSVSGRSENNSYAGYLAFGTSTSLGAHAERMRIDSSGNVGIGTSSPQKTFVISDNGAIGIEFSPDDAGQGYSRILNYDRNASAYEPLYVEAEDLRFSTGASATERMRIDSSGRVTMPYQPSFFAYHNAGDIYYVPNQILPYQNTRHNVGNHYNTSTSTFTAPIAGTYLFSATCNAAYSSSYAGIPRAYWQVNGSNIGNGVHFRGNDLTGGSASGLTQRSSTILLQLSANDTVRIQVQQNQFDLFGANHFMGHLIG